MNYLKLEQKRARVKFFVFTLEPSRTATLQESDLKDGLKMLTLQEGRFWPARLNSTPLPDIFGVVVEGQRGNRPNIMARDDILNQAVRL